MRTSRPMDAERGLAVEHSAPDAARRRHRGPRLLLALRRRPPRYASGQMRDRASRRSQTSTSRTTRGRVALVGCMSFSSRESPSSGSSLQSEPLGEREDRFFCGHASGGILFVAMLFGASAVAGSLVAGVSSSTSLRPARTPSCSPVRSDSRSSSSSRSASQPCSCSSPRRSVSARASCLAGWSSPASSAASSTCSRSPTSRCSHSSCRPG